MPQGSFRRLAIATSVLIATAFSGSVHAQQLNPSQIQWKLTSGSGAPTASCTSANYGQPYQDTSVTPSKHYKCGTNGWEQDAVLGGAMQFSATNPPQFEPGWAANPTFTPMGALITWTGSHTFSPTGWYGDYFSGLNWNVQNNQPSVDLARPAYGGGGHGLLSPYNFSATSRGSSFLLYGTSWQQNSISDSGQYDYFYCQNGEINDDDETCFHINVNGGELADAYGGTLTGSGTGGTTGQYITATCTTDCGLKDPATGLWDGGAAGDMRYMIRTDAGGQMTTGHVVSVTAPSGQTPEILTIDSTVPVSTAWGSLSGNCGETAVTSPAGTSTASYTCAVNLNGISAFGNSPGNFAAGDYVCFAGQYHEVAKVTSVSGTAPNLNITLNLAFPHNSGSAVMANGACGTYIDFLVNRGQVQPGYATLKFPSDVIGSIASNKLVDVFFFRANGGTTTGIASVGSDLLIGTNGYPVGLSNTGGTVTMGLNNGLQYYLEWNGQDIYIVSASDSAFVGPCTGFKFVHTVDGSWSGSCTQAASAGHTATSATAVLNCTSRGIGCTANQYGNGDFVLYKGTQVRDVQNPNNNNLPDGTYFAVEPNPWTWSAGGTIEESHHPAAQYQLQPAFMQAADPIQSTVKGYEANLSGTGVMMPYGSWYFGLLNGYYSNAIMYEGSNTNPYSNMQYYGGTSDGIGGVIVGGPLSIAFGAAQAPLNGRDLIAVGCPATVGSVGGCGDPNYYYALFAVSGNNAAEYNGIIDGLNFWPGTNTFQDSNPSNTTWQFGKLQEFEPGTGYRPVPSLYYTTSAANDIVIFHDSNLDMQDSGVALVGGGTHGAPTFTSGTFTAGDLVSLSNTTGGLQDSGLSASSLLKLTPYTVSTLPACNSGAQGTRYAVTDATTPSYLATLTGGGSTYTPVACNGSAWVAY